MLLLFSGRKMHALGLEHEFRLCWKDSNKLAKVESVYKVLIDSINSIDWEKQNIPGAWVMKIKASEDKDLLYEGGNLKLAYFQRMLDKFEWERMDEFDYFLAVLNDEVIELKYLYLFLCRDSFPDLEKISINWNDLYLVSNPNLKILTVSARDPRVPDLIKISKGRAKIKAKKLPDIPINDDAMTILRFYTAYKQYAPVATGIVNVHHLVKFMRDFFDERVEDEHQRLIEVKSVDYLGAKVSDVIKTHKEVTDNVVSVYEGFYGMGMKVPTSQYIKKQKNSLYSGSYHVWFTLPKIEGVPRDVANYYAVLLLQWVEPLLFSYGMQDIDYLCKSTFRMCGNNMYSGFGSTDPESLLGRPKTLREVIRDGADFYGEGGQGLVSKKDLDETVKGSNGEEILFTEGSPRISPVLLTGGAKTYFDYIEDFSGGENMEKLIGNDIRFLKNYEGHILADEDGKIIYAYIEDGWVMTELSEESVLDRRMYAFEVRIFDNSSLELMEHKMESMALIFQHAVDTMPDVDWCFLDEDWHRAMAESLYHGHNAVLNDNYLRKVNEIFGTNISKTLSLDSFWEKLVEDLYDRYNKSTIYKAFVR